MEEEREELTRKYFPQIHHLCNAHGIQFVAVDMRWGITKESAESAQVINICLGELDRSDIFIGFFGQVSYNYLATAHPFAFIKWTYHVLKYWYSLKCSFFKLLLIAA